MSLVGHYLRQALPLACISTAGWEHIQTVAITPPARRSEFQGEKAQDGYSVSERTVTRNALTHNHTQPTQHEASLCCNHYNRDWMPSVSSILPSSSLSPARDRQQEFSFDQSVRYSIGCDVLPEGGGVGGLLGLSAGRECLIVLIISLLTPSSKQIPRLWPFALCFCAQAHTRTLFVTCRQLLNDLLSETGPF